MENHGAIARHFSKIENKTNLNQVKNIDLIYLINLDKRTDRLNRCLQQLSPFHIQPHRVPGIDGWSLSQEVFNDIAMKITPSMTYDKSVHYRFVAGGTPGEPFSNTYEGKACLHSSSPAGGMGGCLAHLSILNDGHLSGYQTIWVLEDDFTVKNNPHVLGEFIDHLNEAVGPDGWDVLYTDDDDYFTARNLHANLGGETWIRPGMPMTSALIERKSVGDHFYKIGGRTQAHSYLVSRSGMKKIIDYVKNQGLFLPFDTELPCVPEINLFNLKYDVVHGRDRKYSDTWVKRS